MSPVCFVTWRDDWDTVIVIEHDNDIVANADHLIEIGPGAGSEGGEIIFSGNPTMLRSVSTPWARILKGSGAQVKGP